MQNVPNVSRICARSWYARDPYIVLTCSILLCTILVCVQTVGVQSTCALFKQVCMHWKLSLAKLDKQAFLATDEAYICLCTTALLTQGKQSDAKWRRLLLCLSVHAGCSCSLIHAHTAQFV